MKTEEKGQRFMCNKNIIVTPTRVFSHVSYFFTNMCFFTRTCALYNSIHVHVHVYTSFELQEYSTLHVPLAKRTPGSQQIH